MSTMRHFAVKLRRSPLGRKPDQRRTAQSLGLRKFGKTVYVKDTPENRGILYKIVHLLDVEVREGEAPLSTRARVRAQREANKGN
jgi:large subunit ribosomal protein L30